MVVVMVDKGGLNLLSRAFLKLYDRRFASQLRRDNRTVEWSVGLQKAYLQAVSGMTISEFLHKLHTILAFEDDTEAVFNDMEVEAYVDDELFKLFTAEVAAYDALLEQQGKCVRTLRYYQHQLGPGRQLRYQDGRS